MADGQRLFLVLGNQLFPQEHHDGYENSTFFLAEDMGLCTYVRHHQQKIVLFLAAMRAYADELRKAGREVVYRELQPDITYEEKLGEAIAAADAVELVHFEIEDKAMELRIIDFCAGHKLQRTELASPMFQCSREDFAAFAEGRKTLRMADFYKSERQRLEILLESDGSPRGGKWSYDADNRKKLPRDLTPPDIPAPEPNKHVSAVVELTEAHFSDHPGTAADFWWPTTRRQAQDWLQDFLEHRLENFGPYEDAISQRSETVFHSLLSPLLNLGLLTPDEVVTAVLQRAQQHEVPIQSVEGIVRQVIGWREFIRGVYREFGDQQEQTNFWEHERQLTADWDKGTTGIPPLDEAIKTAHQLGWLHHISRLMIVGNLMTLSEIHPHQAHRWFMEMFVDSSEWVMGPNVYGMGLFSDGGVFATKPYICGSNYWLKMSDYKKGEWCDTVDGLYWRFIDKHRDYFSGNPRLAVMPRALDRLSGKRKEIIFPAAEAFLERCTIRV